MNFGDKLRELRMSKGLSQKELADAASVTQAAVAHWEAGKKIPAFDTVQTVCAALGVDCTVFNGCDYEPAENKRGRGRPAKAARSAKRKGKGA